MTTTQTPSTFETQGLACAPPPPTDWRPEWMKQGLVVPLPAAGSPVDCEVGRLQLRRNERTNAMKDMDCPPLPPTRVRHRGDKIDARGRVSALCFPKPRAIDMKRATWVMSDDAVTCQKCRSLILARSKTPNANLTGRQRVRPRSKDDATD